MSFFKQIGIIFIISLLVIKALVAPILLLDYELRKDYIIKNYCINKNKPELHCDGKCYLAKRIQQANQQDEQQATQQFIDKFFSIESVTNAELFIEYQLTVIETASFYIEAQQSLHAISPILRLLQPPRA